MSGAKLALPHINSYAGNSVYTESQEINLLIAINLKKNFPTISRSVLELCES